MTVNSAQVLSSIHWPHLSLSSLAGLSVYRLLEVCLICATLPQAHILTPQIYARTQHTYKQNFGYRAHIGRRSLQWIGRETAAGQWVYLSPDNLCHNVTQWGSSLILSTVVKKVVAFPSPFLLPVCFLLLLFILFLFFLSVSFYLSLGLFFSYFSSTTQFPQAMLNMQNIKNRIREHHSWSGYKTFNRKFGYLTLS